MVKVWTEIEKRNLDRMVKNGMKCQTAVDIKDHVLVMEFMGIYYLLHEQVLLSVQHVLLEEGRLASTSSQGCCTVIRSYKKDVVRLDESGDHVQSGRGSRNNWGRSELVLPMNHEPHFRSISVLCY
ncbi:uncharacterized protein LOC126799193 isoform X2 [Argentina anserina]|uniref:uncharacterized protein LOC126799193 isoform X2 n=1 Tax=Argentina anserina TaxID=57926 RepID=UPI00217691BD|nr:uncharacterized protein LOC126799193 isoform X2 [Potentilla anserina]